MGIMATTSPVLRVAILDCEHLVTSVSDARGSLSVMLQQMLCKGIHGLKSLALEDVEFTHWDVIEGQYPTDLASLDLIIVSGSSASAYDQASWVRNLNDWILKSFADFPNLKFFGACFGHQITCQSLLGKYGVSVKPRPARWVIGVQPVSLSSEFQSVFGGEAHLQEGAGRTGIKDNVARLQMLHADEVVVPEGFSPPEGWISVGTNAGTKVQGFYLPGRILTLQGHVEFDQEILELFIEAFGVLYWDQKTIEDALVTCAGIHDSQWMAERIALFATDDRF